MRELGRVVRLQVQRSSLKTGEKPHRVYDPAPILTVERLAVSPDGALGEAGHDAWMVDVHHRMHPSTKNPDGEHEIGRASCRERAENPVGGGATKEKNLYRRWLQ